MLELICDVCGSTFKRKASWAVKFKRKFCSRACWCAKPVSGTHDAGGYRRAGRRGTSTLEHRLIVEAHIGRHLRSDEVVHHKNGIRDDNRIENLEVTDQVTHMREHLPLSWDLEKAKAMHGGGMSFEDIAAEFGVTQNAVRSAFIRRGLPGLKLRSVKIHS